MTTFDRQAVVDSLSRLVTPGIKLTALADELGTREHEYSALRELLLELVEEGVAQVLPGGAFALARKGDAVALLFAAPEPVAPALAAMLEAAHPRPRRASPKRRR